MAGVIQRWENKEIYKCVLTFDNNQTLTVLSTNDIDTDNVLLDLRLNENDAITSGNPVGVMSPNSCNVEIFTKSNSLIPTNTASPYYGFMRNGVKVELFISQNNGVEWENTGKYYAQAWGALFVNGGYEAASISCTDKLSYIGNLDVPKLTLPPGGNVTGLLTELFTKIGLTTLDYSIHPSLTLPVTFPLASGGKVRDVLNTVAQSLIARVTLDRNGVVQVLPAFPTVLPVAVLDGSDGERFNFQYNENMDYNSIRLSYLKVDYILVKDLVTLSNLTVKADPSGFTTLAPLKFDEPVVFIDQVYFRLSADAIHNSGQVTSLYYDADQNSITVKLGIPTDVTGTLVILGIPVGQTNAHVETGVTSSNPKIGNNLALTSYMIQDDNTASDYVNNINSYLSKMRTQLVMTGTMSPYITTGIVLTLATGDIKIDGNYLVTSFETAGIGANYGATATMVKV